MTLLPEPLGTMMDMAIARAIRNNGLPPTEPGEAGDYQLRRMAQDIWNRIGSDRRNRARALREVPVTESEIVAHIREISVQNG